MSKPTTSSRPTDPINTMAKHLTSHTIRVQHEPTGESHREVYAAPNAEELRERACEAASRQYLRKTQRYRTGRQG